MAIHIKDAVSIHVFQLCSVQIGTKEQIQIVKTLVEVASKE
jgi:hypothetical protein